MTSDIQEKIKKYKGDLSHIISVVSLLVSFLGGHSLDLFFDTYYLLHPNHVDPYQPNIQLRDHYIQMFSNLFQFYAEENWEYLHDQPQHGEMCKAHKGFGRHLIFDVGIENEEENNHDI